MGNGIGKLKFCFAGDVGQISKRRRDIGVDLIDSLDKGLGHSFCYILHDSSSKNQHFLEDSSSSATTTISSNSSSTSQTTAFRTISGASISANTSTTPLSTALVDVSNTYIEKSSAFESSHQFPGDQSTLYVRARFPEFLTRARARSRGDSFPAQWSGVFTSGPLENQYDQQLQRYKPESSKWDIVRNLKKVLSMNLVEKKNNGSLNSLYEDDENNGSFRSRNVQWAQGKAGEDRVHVVISEEYGWVFVGIYDGFNGPDATDFLLKNLYSNVFKELKGLLWHDKLESSENLMCNETVIVQNQEFDQSKIAGIDHLDVLNALSEALRRAEASYLEITDTMVNENPELALMGSCVLVMLMKGNDVYLMNVGDSRAVLAQNPEPDRSIGNLGLINEGSRNSIDTLYRVVSDRKHSLSSCQLTMDHSTSVKEEVLRIRSEHPSDTSAIKNDRVKGSLNITRAFGAGFLKQPKWNNGLLGVFRIDYVGSLPYINCIPSLYHHRLGPRDRFLILSSDGLYQYFTNEEAVSEVETFMSIFPEGDPAQHLVEEVLFRAAKKAGMDFHELLDIPQGDRRKYHDDVSIIIISFEGRIWRSSV
ncbi:hypothetical protein H5410_053114 [Solanum commersonii]|uniref:protein-serine/threonine phosphatase n=1 Tax=Solanum commersonii TaxID=4109 RepID=A0A9J5X413_SOLCO|nr:hypothetical protein H5410_053114 [Solanum commersonii]